MNKIVNKINKYSSNNRSNAIVTQRNFANLQIFPILSLNSTFFNVLIIAIMITNTPEFPIIKIFQKGRVKIKNT